MKKLFVVSAIVLSSFISKAQANNQDPLKQHYRIETIYKDGEKVGYEAYYYSGKKNKGQWVGLQIHPLRTKEEAIERIEWKREQTRKLDNIEWVMIENGEVKTVVNKQMDK
jgi:hypothetical protein